MRVIDVEPDLISMVNDLDIYLKPGSDPILWEILVSGGRFKDLRFYPVNTKGEELVFTWKKR